MVYNFSLTRHIALRTFLVVLAGIIGLLSWGCGTALKYQPKTQLVETMGVQQAQERLRGVLLRSRNPPISAVEITDDFMRVDLSNTTYQVRVFFKDMTRAEVYNNHLVIIWGSGTRILFRPVFDNGQDAMAFADLMLSFRTHSGGN